MLVINRNQEQEIQKRFFQNYVSEFNAFLKENYSEAAGFTDERRMELIHEYHADALDLKMSEYFRINTYIICCFVFGEERLFEDHKIIRMLCTANYETEGMIKYIGRRLRLQGHA